MRKNKIEHRKGNLAISPSKSYQPKIVNDIKNGNRNIDDLHKGRKSYVERSIQLGLYRRVGVCIQEYRENNPDCSYLDVYKQLRLNFPDIFTIPENKMPSGNASKIINSDILWKQAYWCDMHSLISLAKLRINQELLENDCDPNFALSAFEKISRISLEEKKLELNKIDNDSEIPTFVFKNEGDSNGSEPE